MKTISLGLAVFLFLFCTGCGQNKTDGTAVVHERDTAKTTQNAAKQAAKNELRSWKDSLLEAYVRLSGNEMIKSARQNKQLEEWLFDQAVHADTAEYLIYQVGHDVTDEGGTNPRFVTDQWVYIDTITRKLYEYDLPNDSLVAWKRQWLV